MPRTYPPQISPQADQRMHQLSTVIGRAKMRIQKFQRVHDVAWEEAFEILDEFDTDEGARFIARDGYVMKRQKRQPREYVDEIRLHDNMLLAYGNEHKWEQITQPVLNPVFVADSNLLFSKIFEVLGESEACRHVIEAISVRKVNTNLLSMAYATDVNLRQMTVEATVVPEPTFARVRPEWSHDDVNRAGVFGIFKVPLEDVEEVVISREEYDRLAGNATPMTREDAVVTPEVPEAQEEPAPEAPAEPVRRGRGRPRRNPVV